MSTITIAWWYPEISPFTGKCRYIQVGHPQFQWITLWYNYTGNGHFLWIYTDWNGDFALVSLCSIHWRPQSCSSHRSHRFGAAWTAWILLLASPRIGHALRSFCGQQHEQKIMKFLISRSVSQGKAPLIRKLNFPVHSHPTLPLPLPPGSSWCHVTWLPSWPSQRRNWIPRAPFQRGVGVLGPICCHIGWLTLRGCLKIAIEIESGDFFWWIFPLTLGMFDSYGKLPEATPQASVSSGLHNFP